jgi:diguanylate cyclase (GGDEF)-like protein
MPKPFLLIKIMLFASLLSVSSFCYADQSNADKADALFTLINSGTVINNQTLNTYIEQLETLIAKDDTPRLLRLTRVRCWAFDPYEVDQLSKALAFAQHALTKPDLADFPDHKLDLELCQAWFMEQNGDVEFALKGYNKAVNDAYALEDLRLIADARSIRGYLHSYQGNFTQGLEDLITSQSLYQSLNLPAWVRFNLYEIATSYRRFGDQKNAIRYYKKLENSYIKNKDFDAANAVTVSIAIAEEELGNLETAKKLFEQGYLYLKANKKELQQARVAVNMAGTLIKLGDFEKVNHYLNEAEPFILPTDEAFYSFMHLFRAQTYLANGQLTQAHESLALARAAFERVKNIRGLAELQLVESQIFLSQNNWQQAYLALNEYVKQHKELDLKRLSSYTTEMRTRFNADQIEAENRHLIENQRLKEIELAMLEQNKIQQGIIILLGSFLIMIISFFAYKQSQKNKLLSELALTDHLTQLPNRRFIYTKAQRCFEEAKKTQTPLSVIAFDADHFKLINDNFGHEVGDHALVLLADTSREMLSPEHPTARVGGEEFLIILPETDKAQAYKIAQNLIQTVSDANFSEFPRGFALTISAGVASLSTTDKKLSQLLKKADDALYQAKSNGRNQAKMS